MASAPLTFILFIILSLTVSAPVWSLLSTKYPCHTDYEYRNVTGKCLFLSTTRVSRYEAAQNCSSHISNSSRLGRLLNTTDIQDIYNYFGLKANFEHQWVSAVKHNGTFVWEDTNPVIELDNVVSSSPAKNECVAFYTSSYTLTSGDWLRSSHFVAKNCSVPSGYYCEYQAPKCSISDLVGFNPEGMELPYNVENVGIHAHVKCREGFYRVSEISGTHGALLSSGLMPNYVNCSGIGTLDPVTLDLVPNSYSASWMTYSIEECKPVSCDADIIRTIGLKDVLPFEASITKDIYNTSEYFEVTCNLGYASSKEASSKTTKVVCAQNPAHPNLGMWSPSDLVVCVKASCPDIATVIPNNTVAYKALDIHASKWYNEFEYNVFSKYPNEVYVRCRHQGYFFMDEQFHRYFQCVVPNISTTVGHWIGVKGTVMNEGDVTYAADCIETVCNQEKLFRNFEESSTVLDLLESYKVEDRIKVVDGRSNVASIVTKHQFSLLKPLPYNTKLEFLCPAENVFVYPSAEGSSVVGTPI